MIDVDSSWSTYSSHVSSSSLLHSLAFSLRTRIDGFATTMQCRCSSLFPRPSNYMAGNGFFSACHEFLSCGIEENSMKWITRKWKLCALSLYLLVDHRYGACPSLVFISMRDRWVNRILWFWSAHQEWKEGHWSMIELAEVDDALHWSILCEKRNEKKTQKKCLCLGNNALARDGFHSFWCWWITSKQLERSSFVFLSFPCQNRLMFSCHRTFPRDACKTKSNLSGTRENDLIVWKISFCRQWSSVC